MRNLLATLLFLPLLAHAAEEMSPIVVRSDVDKSDSPLVTAIGSFADRDASQIRRQQPKSAKTAIGTEPNVEFIGSPRTNAEIPQIRGLGDARILVLDEGVRQNFQGGHNGRLFSDFSLMERVEIVKGPWSALYGSGAMGGVISLRRSTAEDFIRRTGKDKGGEAAIELGSNSNEFGQRITGFAKAGKVTPLLSYHHSKYRDARVGHGQELPFSALESNDIYSSTGFDLGERHQAGLKLNHFESKTLEPLNPERGDTAISQIGDARAIKEDIVGNYQYTGDAIDVHAKPYVRKTEVARSRQSDRRRDQQTVLTTGVDSWLNFRRKFSDSFATVVTVGGEYFRDKTTGRRGGATLASFPDGTNNQWAGYLQPQLVVAEKLKLTPGIRYDRFSYRSVGYARVHDKKASSKLYASYDLTPMSVVFLGWGQAFNAPRLQDLYASGLHFPRTGPGTVNNFFIANPDLKPEKADTFEAGYRGTHEIGTEASLSTNLTAFRTDARDFIERDVDFTAGTTRFANLTRVRLTGFEAGAKYQRQNWGTGLTYAQVRSKNKLTKLPLLDTPADSWFGTFERYFPRWTAGTNLRFVEAQRRVPTNTSGAQPTGSYLLQDFFATYDHRPWAVDLRMNNAWNRYYRRHGSTNPERGRDLRVTGVWSF